MNDFRSAQYFLAREVGRYASEQGKEISKANQNKRQRLPDWPGLRPRKHTETKAERLERVAAQMRAASTTINRRAAALARWKRWPSGRRQPSETGGERATGLKSGKELI